MQRLACVLLTVFALVTAERALAEITYLGGKGASFAEAVVIHGAEGELDGVPSEYAWLDQNLPGYKVLNQALLQDGAHLYDMMDLRQNGDLIRVFFDITEFVGK